MIQKFKKPLSIVLALMMVVSLFAVVPITAGAATHDSGIIWYPNLQVGDIITANITNLEQLSASPTIVIKGGTYADDMDEIVTNDLTGSNSSISFGFEGGKIRINDMNTWRSYHFVDQNGNETNQMIVLAIEGQPDTEGCTITFGGFDPDAASAATTVDLSTLDTDYEAQDGDTLTGTLAGQYKITVADGATVTLKDATITCLSASTTYDGIALLGDATILLEGENTVKGGHKYNAGIFVPEEKTLTIDGTGSLNVSSGGSVSAIGAKRSGSATGIPGGNIVINGGTINATGGNGGAGIGGCTVTNCGTITINGGNITAVGNDSAPGIGSGNLNSYCAGITITGGTVTATGNDRAAGIGCGYRGSCGNITIADTVTKVTAVWGDRSPNSIGQGSGLKDCGTITIGGEVTGNITQSPYVYPTYTVTWKNGDTVLETDTDVVNGSIPSYDGETPTKAADGDHMYVFSGWTPELAPVTEDVTYTATFASSADLVEITDHETDLADLGLDYDMSKWGRSMTAQEAITLAQYMSAQNDSAKCAVLYEAVDDYELQYAMSDGTTGSRADFYYSSLNDFLPDYKVYYLPVNLNPETIELTLNPDNASVTWYDATDSDGYWSMEAAYNDGCYLVLKGNSNQPAGTYEWADMGSGCENIDYEANKRIAFVDGSCTVTVDEDVVTVSGTFTGSDRNTYVVTVTYEAPYYTITDESVNGTVTAEVNGADVTKAKAGKTVLLNVAPADGYRLKSITASAQKTTPENFSDLVALMGDAVFDGDENYDCGGYTCKVENGKFVVYNGTTLVAELSESNMTGFNGDSDYVEANSEDALWAFFVENGEITGIDVSDTNDYYIFCSLSGSKSTGTLQPVQVDLTTVAEGSQYSFTMPAKNVTVKAEFEEAPKYTVTWKNGDTTLETDENVAQGTTPTYDGATPEKANDDYHSYNFSGWTDGTNTYGASDTLPAVTGDVTYTAKYTVFTKQFTVFVKTTTGKTITANGVSGDTTVAELKNMVVEESGIPAAEQRLIFAGKEMENEKTLADYRIQKESTLHVVGKSYTITWKNDDGTVIDTTSVAYGTTPTHTAPTKAEDENNTYTFSGWTPEITAVTGDATYTAQFTAVPKPAPTPAPAKLILNVGENGKVVMDNGTFGNATDASNITEIPAPINVDDGYEVFIVDGHSVNLVEGGSINIATGGKVSFYPSADNTGKITAIPNEGYICTGWYNGDTRYTTKDTIDYQAISEEMTLTAKFAPKLFPQHSVTLGGDIGVNFYINSAAANFAGASEATVKFTWDGGGKENSKEVSLKGLTPNDDGYYKATVDVVAAHVAHKIHAEVYLNGVKLEQTDDYSVQDYAEEVYKNPEKYDSEKPEKLKELAKALLNYGAMAQTVFKGYLQQEKDPDDTVKTVGKTNFNDISADDIAGKINGTASDLNAIANQLGFKYYTSSVLYLQNNTLRLYFTPNTYQGAMPHADDFKDNQSNYYYYVEKENIPAAKLDDQQSFTIGDKNFTFSALDYAKAVVNSDKMEPEQQNLAKSLYLYNQAANAYFDAAPAPVHTHTPGEAVQENVVPASCTATGSYDEVTYCSECHEELSRETKTIDMLAHTIVAVAEVPATTEADGVAAHYECSVCHKLFSDAEGNNETTAEALVIPQIVEKVVDLSTLTKGYEAQDGDVLINALDGQKYIRIADGATVKLRNANITCLRNSSGIDIAGLTLLGDATIILEGTNVIRGGYEYCPGIHVPEGKTLTIDGTGSLDVSSNGRGFACGIGSNDGTNCGNIVINGGNITAYAGKAAGIGAKSGSSCGNITINGGTVNATSGDYGAGIGSTLYGKSICGDITINGGVVNATANYEGPGIGSGTSANCGNITITGGTVTAIGGEEGAGIGTGNNVSICGNILITGGTVIAKGGNKAAGIGSGYRNTTCGTITIADTVTQVTATKGTDAPNSIGAGDSGSCGTVTIAPGANVIQN